MSNDKLALREAADRISAALLKCGIGVLPATAMECARAALSANGSERLREVGLTRDTKGMCVVTVNGREVIRDNGDVISHFATPGWFAALAAHEAEKQAGPAANDWRRLALQFDGQRMAAMAHLQMLLQSPDHADAVRAFLDQTPSEQIASVRTAEKQAGPVDGWKLVPAEPTAQMKGAGHAYARGVEDPSPTGMYAAMLAVAPPSPLAEQAGPVAAQDAAPAHSIPAGWLFKRNADGSIAIWGPPPLPGESQRTNDVVYANTNRDLHELLGRLADHQAATPSSLAAESHAVVAGIVERIEAALKRIEDGHGIRRSPADPTDPDLVLAECKAFFEGRNAPVWVKPPVQNAAPPSEKQAGPVAVKATAPAHAEALADALEELMAWQVKNVKRWHNGAYDNAHRVLAAYRAQTPAAAPDTAPPSPLAEQDKEDVELTDEKIDALLFHLNEVAGGNVVCDYGLPLTWRRDELRQAVRNALRAAREKKEPTHEQ